MKLWMVFPKPSSGQLFEFEFLISNNYSKAQESLEKHNLFF